MKIRTPRPAPKERKEPSVATLDKAWREAVVKRDGRRCQMCGKIPNPKGLNAHHILPREIKQFRHNIENGITLCSLCHRWGKNSAHQNSLFFSWFLQQNKPEQYAYLMDYVRMDELKGEKDVAI